MPQVREQECSYINFAMFRKHFVHPSEETWSISTAPPVVGTFVLGTWVYLWTFSFSAALALSHFGQPLNEKHAVHKVCLSQHMNKKKILPCLAKLCRWKILAHTRVQGYLRGVPGLYPSIVPLSTEPPNDSDKASHLPLLHRMLPRRTKGLF